MISLAILATAALITLWHLPDFEEEFNVDGFVQHVLMYGVVTLIYTVLLHLVWGVVALWQLAL